jgi:ligand-binding sensor domain-containing protein/two-component sensor histidine kinase
MSFQCHIKHFLASVFILPILYGSAQEQQFNFAHLTIKDGLSQSTVEAIIQSRIGFMWFGTNDGLNKYDGYNFTIYRYDPLDDKSISDNYVYSISEDDSDFLWIATNNGLNRYDPATDTFTRFLNDPEDSTSLSFNLVQTVLIDRNNNIWAGTLGGGLNLFQTSTGTFHRIKHPDAAIQSSILHMITSLCEDNEGNIWAGTYTGDVIKVKFSRDSISNPEFIFYDLSLNLTTEPNENIIWDIKENKNGALWIATNRTGVVKLNPDNGAVTYYRFGVNENTVNDLSIRRILVDDDGSVYFGTKAGGLNILTPDGQFIYIHSDIHHPESLNDNSIWSIYKDRIGALWIGTEFGGINKFDPYRFQFEHFHRYSDNLRKERILYFYEMDNGSIMLGTDGGVLAFDYGGKIFNAVSGTNDLQNDIVTGILEHDRSIWIGTNSRGLFKIYPGGEKTIRFQSSVTNTGTLSNNNIKVMIKGRNGLFWIGTYGGGVDLFDPVEEKVVYNLTSRGIYEKFIYSLLEVDDVLWIGTYGDGLVRYNTMTGEIRRFVHDPAEPHSISNNRIYSMYRDASDRLWIGTTGGLNLFNNKDDTFRVFTIKDGLANDVIYSILEDERGYKWLSTNRGISRFDFSSNSFKNFTPKDGLQDYEFNRGAALKSRDGKLFFGGINGFNVFNPEDLKLNTFIPPIVLTSFKKMNKEVSFPKSISEIDTIILSHEENFFSFTFSALDFTDPESNSYAYMMEGFNEDWIYSGNERTATYMNLNPRTYKFRVKGSNNDGVWNEAGVTVAVIVLPPFWQTLWFRTLAIISFLGLLYTFYRIKLMRAIEIERLRTRIASDLHDDIGSSLTRIAMQSELILEDVNKGDYKKPLREIGEKSRELLATMSDVVWSIDARNDTMSNLLDRMKEVCHSLFERNNISVTFHKEGLVENKKLPVLMRQNLYLIFKEAMNNIAKHSNASEVTVTLKNTENTFKLRITDNGKLKDCNVNSHKTGHGLKNMIMRSERIGGKITIKTENGFDILLTCKAI